MDTFVNFTKIIPVNKHTVKPNISKKKREAINSLRNDQNIVVKEADKGGGIVIMNKELNKTRILDMLKDDNFYEEVPHDCSKITMKKIRNVIQLAHEITQNEIDYLVNFEFKPSSFYCLPKIHKSNLIKSV